MYAVDQVKDTNSMAEFGEAVTNHLFGALLPFFVTVLFYTVRNAYYYGVALRDPDEKEEIAVCVAGPVKLLAALISLIFTGLGVAFMTEVGPNETDQNLCNKTKSENLTIESFACLSQKEIVHSVWGPLLVSLSPIVSGLIALSSSAIPKCQSLFVLNISKLAYILCALFYVMYVSHFQLYFDSLSNSSLYIKSFAILCFLLTIICFMSASAEEQQPDVDVSSGLDIFGVFICLHVSYCGYHLLCGQNPDMPFYIMSYFSLAFMFSMFHNGLLPHVVLGMCLFGIPPVCPFAVSLAAWCFDIVWLDLNKMSRELAESVASVPNRDDDHDRLYYERLHHYRYPNGVNNRRPTIALVRGME